MRTPSSTPAGILTLRVTFSRTRPSPVQSTQGSVMTEPWPEHCGQGREVMTWPRKDRVTCETSPWPWHISHVVR